jgi:CheY-like chemotaxis protein
MIAGAEVQPEPLDRPRVVVIAEDEVLIRWALAEQLRAFGWNIIEVATADDAIEILQTTAQVDMVITDVNMPGRANGFELAAFVACERPTVTVVIMSGNARPQDCDERLFDIFVSKPFDERELAVQLRNLIHGNASAG